MAKNLERKVLQAIQTVVREELRRFRDQFVGRMTVERLSGRGPASLGVRTGQLRRSLGVKLFDLGTRQGAVGFIGGGVPYALIHEKGGTIYPKSAQNLAIPVGKSLTKAGVARLSGPRASTVPLRFIKNHKTGNLLLIVDQKKKGKNQPVDVRFVLKRFVQIPARLGFKTTFNQEAQVALDRIKARVSEVRA